jgi:hypothetical protein
LQVQSLVFDNIVFVLAYLQICRGNLKVVGFATNIPNAPPPRPEPKPYPTGPHQSIIKKPDQPPPRPAPGPYPTRPDLSTIKPINLSTPD